MGERSLPQVLIDCRWLGHAGPGRVTELLLRGLGSCSTNMDLKLWGDQRALELIWPGAEVIGEFSSPTALKGQADWFRIPDCDLAVFMHQQRPLRRMPSVSVIYDTIPLHFARGPIDRWVKKRFLKQVVQLSNHLVTFSQHSRRCILGELGASTERVSVLGLPVDTTQAAKVLEERLNSSKDQTALFVGRFLPHKNLPRLLQAFQQTDFAGDGGRLVLVGGSKQEAAQLRATLTERQRLLVDIRSRCGQRELDDLFARCLFLIQPSLEEGFGLPVWEALSCGMPVCASDGGSLPEITFGNVQHFNRQSVSDMAQAIDSCAVQAVAMSPSDMQDLSMLARQKAASVEAFGQEFCEVMMAILQTRSAR